MLNSEVTATEVIVPKSRRVFTDRYKAGILEQLDACSVLGDKGALLRREGLYHSAITRWRRQMARKTKAARGRPKTSSTQRENEALKRQVEELESRLQRAETIIDVQKKLSLLLEPLSTQRSSESSK